MVTLQGNRSQLTILYFVDLISLLNQAFLLLAGFTNIVIRTNTMANASMINRLLDIVDNVGFFTNISLFSI